MITRTFRMMVFEKDGFETIEIVDTQKSREAMRNLIEDGYCLTGIRKRSYSMSVDTFIGLAEVKGELC